MDKVFQPYFPFNVFPLWSFNKKEPAKAAKELTITSNLFRFLSFSLQKFI